MSLLPSLSHTHTLSTCPCHIFLGTDAVAVTIHRIVVSLSVVMMHHVTKCPPSPPHKIFFYGPNKMCMVRTGPFKPLLCNQDTFWSSPRGFSVWNLNQWQRYGCGGDQPPPPHTPTYPPTFWIAASSITLYSVNPLVNRESRICLEGSVLISE